MYNGILVYYDEFLLNNYIVIQNIETRLFPKVANSYQGLPHRSGTKPLYSVYGQISVKIDYTIKHNVLETKDVLNRILFTRTDKPLKLGDQLDRHLMCRLDGDTKLSSRVIASEGTLEFLSPNHYWSATKGFSAFQTDSEGRVVIENKGSAPTEPIITIEFKSDCGYIALVAPNGYLSLGNPKEIDNIPVPPTEFAINHKFTNSPGWTKITDGAAMIPDYIKLSSLGTAKHDAHGMFVDTSTLGTTEQWNGHMYARNFVMGSAEIEADNFILETSMDIYDNSGKRDRTTATLIVVMDQNNVPMMSTSIYDISSDKNELVVTFKVPDFTKPNHSKIIYSGKLNRLNGKIQMSKSGSKFEWIVNDTSTTTVNTSRPIEENDIVQLNNNVRHIYSWTGVKLPLDTRIIGQDLRVFEIRNSPAGRYGLRNVRYGYVEGFFNAEDIKQASASTVTTKPTTLKHLIDDQAQAQYRPYKVVIWQAKWGATLPYNISRIKEMTVKRLYTTDKLEIENTFKAGDQLIIDNREERILLNGLEFTGFVDVDSRFFDVDGGYSELVIQPSEWANMPNAIVELESRWF